MGVLKGFDSTSVKRERAVVGNDRHNIVRPGLNYMGHCRNTACTANTKAVVHHRGSGTFIVNDDMMSEVAACPICRKPFELEQLVLHQCAAKATVLRHVEETTEYRASGRDELLMISAYNPSPGGKTPVLPLQSDALLTMTVTTSASSGGKCCVM